MHKLIRYAIAAIGPIGSAGAQFLLSVAMLRLLPTHDFGTLSFLLVASVFSWGVWAALLCAPLPVILFQSTPEDRVAGEDAILAVNLYGSLAAVILFGIIGWATRLPPGLALLFGAYSGVALIRWFARAYAYAYGRQFRVVASDLIYSGTLIAGIAVMTFDKSSSLLAVYAILLISAAAGILPFGWKYCARQATLAPRHIAGYAKIWRSQASWSLLGVVTTEATGNAHAYLVTLMMGPAAFAPIAASALVTRPISVASNALADFERPRMSREIGEGRIAEVWQSIRIFRIVLLAVWLAGAGAVVALYLFAPTLIFPKHYDLHTLVMGTAMWTFVAWLRVIRIPEGSVMHASGAFKPLAYASLWSSAVTVAIVTVMIHYAGALWSIVGIIVGQSIFSFWTIVYARRQLKETERSHGEATPMMQSKEKPI